MNKIYDWLLVTFGVTGIFAVVVLVFALLLLGPVLTIWAINTITEHAGVSFYIPHNIWTYLAVFWLMLGPDRESTLKKS